MAAQMARRLEEGAELFIREWHETERRKVADRRAKAAAAPFTIGISKRPGGGGRGIGGKREGGRAEGARRAQETEVWVWVWPSSS